MDSKRYAMQVHTECKLDWIVDNSAKHKLGRKMQDVHKDQNSYPGVISAYFALYAGAHVA